MTTRSTPTARPSALPAASHGWRTLAASLMLAIALPANATWPSPPILLAGGSCGNNSVDSGESCDDGDAEYVIGDYCSADCNLVPCGIPTDPNRTSPTTSDALYVLKAAVQTLRCDVRVCDVNDSETITTADALLILRRAVGQDVLLVCPSD